LKFAVRFACSMDRIERVSSLTLIIAESSGDDYKKVVYIFIVFPESQVSCLLDV
jgi:hypothetical protein